MGAELANSSWGPEATDPPCAGLSAGRRLLGRVDKVAPRLLTLIPLHITRWLGKAWQRWERCGLDGEESTWRKGEAAVRGSALWGGPDIDGHWGMSRTARRSLKSLGLWEGTPALFVP